MKSLLNNRARKLTPYVPGEQPKVDNLIKLNTNENPYPYSKKAADAIIASVANLVRYPSPECHQLRDTIAKVEGLPSRDYVYAGNGSDEILAFCFQAFFKEDKPVLFPDVTYSFYPVYCALYDLDFTEIPLDKTLKINIDDYDKETGGIIFPNPNAPTGELTQVDEIKRLLDINRTTIVVIDEAYIDFGGKTCVSLIKDYPNLAITRTLSKSHALAGLRCGYIMAQPSLIDGIIMVKNSFNSYTSDTLSQVGAQAAIDDVEYKNEICNKVINTRDKTIIKLRELGFIMGDSKSNFIFAKHSSIEAIDLFNELKSKKILVRHFKTPERINQYLRISIGTDPQMDYVIEIIKNIISKY